MELLAAELFGPSDPNESSVSGVGFSGLGKTESMAAESIPHPNT